MTLPERLGRLRRVDRIGAGGFATVWLYHDDDLDSPVAVKALADNWAARADVRERFLEEARMLRRADSDHVVRVYDIGEVDQTPYFVMSYADRGSLATLTDVGAIPADRAVDLITQAGIGVHVLHQRGIIHRDIKPQNLLLRSGDDDTEQVLVADLGVAKAMLHASGLTQVVGTPAYMAPEQAIGLGIDRRADVHALGAVAYHLMTGRIARHGGIADLAVPQRPAAPSEVRPELAAYDEVLLRSIAQDPDERWPDVPSFVGALKAARSEAARSEYAFLYEAPRSVEADTVYLQRTTVEGPAPAAALPAPAEPAPRRRRRVLGVVAACVLLTAAVAAGGYALVVAQRGTAAGGGEPTTGPASTATTSYSIAPDIRFPPLTLSTPLTQQHRIVSPGGSVWSYRVPPGWVPSFLNGAGNPVSSTGQKVDQQTQIRWRPAHEDAVGGYSLRFRALEPTFQPWQQLIQRRSLLENAHYPGFEVYQQTRQAIWFKYIDGAHHLRYNFWRWVPDASGQAGLEISVSGREQDVDGLDALLTRAAADAHPVG